MALDDARDGGRSPRARALLGAAWLLLAIGCGKDPAAQRAHDKAQLERIVTLDVRASSAMKDADEAAVTGDAGAALGIVGARARPAVDEALRAAEAAPMQSPWGGTRRDELAGLLRARKEEMARYEGAIRSGDPEAMLEAMKAQADIERRALGVVAAIREGR